MSTKAIEILQDIANMPEYDQDDAHRLRGIAKRGLKQLQAPTVPIGEVERACEILHDAYEAAAVQHGWKTQEASRKPWSEVPEANKATMRSAVAVLLSDLQAQGEGEPVPEHCSLVGCKVILLGVEWTVTERAYTGDWAVERIGTNEQGERVRQRTSIPYALLPPSHPAHVVFATRTASAPDITGLVTLDELLNMRLTDERLRFGIVRTANMDTGTYTTEEWTPQRVRDHYDEIVAHLAALLRSLPSSTGVPNYSMSRDYEALWERIKVGAMALGVVTIFREERGACHFINDSNGYVGIKNTGAGTTWSADKEQFVHNCQRLNLEWLSPSKEPETHIGKLDHSAQFALEAAQSILMEHDGDDGSGVLGVGKDLEVGSTAFRSVKTWVKEALKAVKAGQLGPVIRYHSEVSGMWYENRFAAGDIDVIEIDGLTYMLKDFEAPKEPASSPEGAGDAWRKKNMEFWQSAWDHPPTRDFVERELYDYLQFMDTAAKVYCHVTDGRIGKVNTTAEAIIGEADDCLQRAIDEAVAEAKLEWERPPIPPPAAPIQVPLIAAPGTQVRARSDATHHLIAKHLQPGQTYIIERLIVDVHPIVYLKDIRWIGFPADQFEVAP